jgi:hypothetical protein
MTKLTKFTFTVMPLFYLRTSRSWTLCPSGSRKRKAGRSDSIRSIGNDSTWKIAWFGVNSISGARSRAIGAKLRKRSSCGACVSGTPSLLEHGLSRLDKLLLSPADLAVEAYLRVMVEVSAAYQPEQLVDVVGRDASIACQPTYRLEHLIVTSTWGQRQRLPKMSLTCTSDWRVETADTGTQQRLESLL